MFNDKALLLGVVVLALGLLLLLLALLLPLGPWDGINSWWL